MGFTGSPCILRPMNTTTTSGSRLRATLVAAGAAVGLSLAGLGIAAAQTEPTEPTNPPAEQAPEREGPRRAHGGKGHKGMGMGIHGEFTTRTPDGTGFQTMATQHGEVTEVSATSLTVKSEDGFSRTYVVNDDTMVNAGNEGIGDVKQGDQVHVMAVVRDGKAFAVEVRDATQAKALRDKWAPRRQPPAGAPTTGGTSS